MEGWIKLHRKILENPVICKDADHFYLWCYLLLSATHQEITAVFNGKKITLMPGQLITGRKAISTKTGVNESKTQRVLKKFEIEHQIEQQTNRHNRLITIINWSDYQQSEQPFEQVMNNKRTTNEQLMNTNKNERMKECKNERKENKDICRFAPPTIEEIFLYCSERKNKVDAERFFNFYESKGWMVGKNKMKDWKAAVRTWEKSDKQAPEKSYYREDDMPDGWDDVL